MKKILTAIFLLAVFAAASFGTMIKGSQYELAKKYADKDQAPVVYFDPETGAALGFILYADLDGKEGEELIIPYRIRKGIREIEDKADPAPQILSVDIVQDGKKIRGFMEVDLAYVREPRPHLTVRKIKEGELPKLFLLVYDGFDKGHDAKFSLLYNSFDKADKEREKYFETIKMPWDFLLYQFLEKPSVIEFHTKLRESFGRYYIRALDKNYEIPEIPQEKINEFNEKLAKYRKEIYWEYGK